MLKKVGRVRERRAGRWRFTQRDADGREFAFHGVNHEVHAPERIIGTLAFEGLPEPGHERLDEILQALPGR